MGVMIGWFVFLSRGEIGSKAQWFSGAGAFSAVAVAMWQTLRVQRRAQHDAAEAAERLRVEVAAAERRSARDVAAAEQRSARELALTQSLHGAELAAQRELARVERAHLVVQQQKQAMVEVSRAVSTHTQMLAALWNQGADILRLDDRNERERAMQPVFEQIAQVVNDFSVELSNAQLLIADDRLHHALDRVNEAAVMAVRVAEEVHIAVVEGHLPRTNTVPEVQRLMHRRAAEARHLAWELVRTGLDYSAIRPAERPSTDGAAAGTAVPAAGDVVPNEPQTAPIQTISKS
ncbi:MAG: hypothetical protein JO152_03790 [Mycobacteriaceae bacterium]|nr:hypothetical protein [Mycobacteriaceae bacterium]